MSELKKITIDGVKYDLPSGGGEGGYIKPDDGIPKSDLNQSVQDSLDKADTALQSFTETDPTVPAHVKSITETDISNWNNKAETSDIPNVPEWALKETKPTYTASEVGALPDDTVIPEQLTEADILDMGFTKNTGTYIKPELGIPKSDLSEDVQNSLDKAETDPTVPSHVKSITETDISNWNDKLSTDLDNIDEVGTKKLQELAADDDNISEAIAKIKHLEQFETDPTVPSYVKNITEDEITKWNDQSYASLYVNNIAPLWSGTVTYAKGDLCSSDVTLGNKTYRRLHISLQDNNKGHLNLTDNIWWAEYIPNLNNTINDLTTDNDKINLSVVELKMLGWTVPTACPIKNYTDNNGIFHQRVERVDMGTLVYGYNPDGYFYSSSLTKKAVGNYNIFSSRYVTTKKTSVASMADKEMKGHATTNTSLFIKDSTYGTDPSALKNSLNGVYLYYELATEKTFNAEGREIYIQVDDLKMLGYTIPKECPVQNYTDANGIFHQRATRVDMGNLTWVLNANTPVYGGYEFISPIPNKANGVLNAYSNNYKTESAQQLNCLRGRSNSAYVSIILNTPDTKSSSAIEMLKGKYLYYELATEITTPVEGNEQIVNKANLSGDTFIGDVNIQKSNPSIILQESRYNLADTPTSNSYDTVYFRSNDNKTRGFVTNVVQTTGRRYTTINCQNSDNSKTVEITGGFNADGTRFTSAPTPSADSNDTNIATTKWVNDKINQITSQNITLSPSEGLTLGTTKNLYGVINNGVKCLSFNIQGTTEKASVFYTLCTLPEKFRPTVNIIHNYVTQSGANAILQINTNGVVQTYVNQIVSNYWIIRTVITYL